MKIFALSLAFFLGLWTAKDEPIALRFTFLFLSAIVAYAFFKKGSLRYFLIGFLFGLALGLLFLIPCPSKTAFTCLVVKTGNGYAIAQEGIFRYYLADKSGAYEVGDILSVQGSSSPFIATSYESQFDFRSYLNAFGVKNELSGKVSFCLKMPFRFKQYETSFLSNFGSDEASLLSSLLFARNVSSDFSTQASGLGIIFAFSLSGFFFSLCLKLYEAIASNFLFDKSLKISAACIAALFLPLGLRKVGLLRVVILRWVDVIYRFYVIKRPHPLDRLGIGALACLGVDYHFAYQSGFLFSFGLGLYFHFLSPLIQDYKKTKRRILSIFFLRIFLLPLAFLGGEYHFFAWLYSYSLLPLSMLILLLGYLSFVTFPFAHVLGGLCQAEAFMVKAYAGFDPSVPLVPFSLFFLVLFYLCLAAYLFCKEIHFWRSARAISIGFVSLYLVSCVPIHFPLTYQVSFINVGQGDSILVRRGGDCVLIDTGGVVGKDLAKETLIPFLHKQRIYRLDALIASHQDYDHMGAASSLIKNFSVGKYLTEVGERLTIGSITFINYNTYGGSDKNDTSSVLWTKLGDTSFLFTGDASSSIEENIVRDHPSLRCDILKAGHHGSKTSSSAAFLDLLKPKTAIISCGAKNKYGHPDAEVIARLKARNIEIRYTKDEGTIHYRGFI